MHDVPTLIDVDTPIAHMFMCGSHAKYEHFVVDASAKLGHATCFCKFLIWTKTEREIETFFKVFV